MSVTRNQANQEDAFRRVTSPMMVNASQNDGETTVQAFVANTPAMLTSGATVRYIEGFTPDAVNAWIKLTETGVTTRKFTVNASMTIASATGSTLFTAYLYRNGSPIAGVQGAAKSANSNDATNIAIAGAIAEFSTDDYFQLWVKTSTSGDVTLSNFTYLIKEDGR